MLGQTQDQRKMLSYIAASTAALRKRLESLQVGKEPEAEGSILRPEERVIAEAALTEANNLIQKLKPLAIVAAEFRVKWDDQKQRLLEARQADLSANLFAESEALAQRAELAAEEEMKAIAFNSEQASSLEAKRTFKTQEARLRGVADVWHQEVYGADQSHVTDVDKALRSALQRVNTWAAEEERHIMSAWTRELSSIIGTTHALDEEALEAAEDTQLARKAVLESALARHWKALASGRSGTQDLIRQLARELQECSGRRAQSTAQKASLNAAVSKAARVRMALAKSEAQEAMQTHRQSAESQVEHAAQRQLARTAAFQSAMQEMGPVLLEKLDEELAQLRIAAKDSGDTIRAVPAEFTEEELEEEAAVGLARQDRRFSVLPGAAAVKRPTMFQYGGAGPKTFDQPLGGVRVASEEQSSPEDEDEAASDGSDGAERQAQLRLQRVERIKHHRKKFMAAQAGLQKGEWYQGWRRSLAEVVNSGRAAARDAEAALEGQAGVLRKKEHNDETMQVFSDTFMSMAHGAKNYASSIKDEMARIRNMKAGLAVTRTDYIHEIMNRQEQESPGAERELLPHVAKLSRETETLSEVGRTLDRGADRFPVVVVGQSWRRVVSSSLPLLLRLWQTAGAPQEEQRDFLNKMLAVVSKTADGREQLHRSPVLKRPTPV